jgi:hypothetical protein
MTWTELFNGQTSFDWVLSPINEFNLLRVTHLDLVGRGSLVGSSTGRTEIAQFDEMGTAFFEPKVVRSEVELQIILWPKFSQFQRGKIGIRNSLGFDPQRIKVEGMTVGIFFETSQQSNSVTINKKAMDRKNLAQEVLPENFNRKGLTLRNNTKVVANINFMGDATVTDWVYQIPVGGTYEMDPNFLGRVSVWFDKSDATKPTATFAGETLTVMEFL